jgi:hypothetical protein
MARDAIRVGWQLSREFNSYDLVFGPSSSLQRRVAELQANGSCDIGRQATSEDSASVIVNCSEL